MKCKKQLVLFSSLLVFSFSLFAQSNLEFYTGISAARFKNSSLRTTMKSYENYFKNNGEPNITIKTTNWNREYCYGLNYLLDHDGVELYIFGFQHSNISNEQIATLSTGKRHFKSIQIGDILYFGIKKDNGISYKGGLGYTTCILESSFEYPNGIRSLGIERLANGVYVSRSNMSLNAEFTYQKVFFMHLGVEAGLALYGSLAGEYRDNNKGKFENSGGLNHRIIPQDFEAAQTAINAGDGYYGKTLNGSYYSAGLIFKISYLLIEQY